MAFACVVTAIHDPATQVFATMIILITCMLTTSLSRPFVLKLLDFLDITGQFAVAMCVLVAATFCGTSSDRHNNVVATASIFTIVGITFVSVAVLAAFIMRTDGRDESRAVRCETEMTNLNHSIGLIVDDDGSLRGTRNRASDIFVLDDLPDVTDILEVRDQARSNGRLSTLSRHSSVVSLDCLTDVSFDEQFSSHLNDMNK